MCLNWVRLQFIFDSCLNNKNNQKFLSVKINRLTTMNNFIHYFVLHNTILFIYLCNVKLEKRVRSRLKISRKQEH